LYTVSQKRVDFVTVARNSIRIDFDDIWQKYSKDSENSVCMFEFVCFLSTFRLSNRKLQDLFQSPMKRKC